MKKQLFMVLTAFLVSLLLSSFTMANVQEIKEKDNEFVYFTGITGWVSATESYSYSIYYQEGLDGRVYYVKPSWEEYWSISDNEYYNSPVCSDYRTKFRYVSNGVYFNCDLPYRAKDDNGGFIFITQIKGWVSSTDYYIYSIYYQEGLDGRVYYVKPSWEEYWSISDNEYYNSPVCSDYRTKFRYVSNGVYFNCDLPYRAKDDNGGFVFITQIKGWVSSTDYYIYSIYYKEGAGERSYFVKPSWEEYWSVSENEYYHNPECQDYRKNFRYVSYGVYFNCDSPLLR